MKKNILSLFAVATLAACSSATEADYRPPAVVLDGPVEVTLAVGETKAVGDTELRVEFLGVIEDSRCPVDVTCVWEGNAAAEIRLSLGTDPATTVRVNTSVAPATAEYDAVSFRIVRLMPEPVQTAPTPPADYQITLRFTQR